MKFNYTYRTSENEMREGVISAPSRDAVFKALKAKGIRPSRVELSAGFLNRLQLPGKRGYAIVLLALTLVVTGFLLYRKTEEVESMYKPTHRHQIYGEPALMEELSRQGYATVFADAADRCLAHFAQPGVEPPFDAANWKAVVATAIRSGFHSEIRIEAADSREVRELKQIVLWMREECRDYLADGIGTPEKYADRLAERLRLEQDILRKARQMLDEEKTPAKLAEINASLRKIGLRTLRMPSKGK